MGCDPYNVLAVQRLLAVKQRPAHKGLILVAANSQQIEPLLYAITPVQRARLERAWPGPTTFVLPDPQARLPASLRGAHLSIAVRVSDHQPVQRLCAAFKGPIVSTSANLSGSAATRNLLLVRRYLGSNIDYILPAKLGNLDEPTPIIDVQTGRHLRI